MVMTKVETHKVNPCNDLVEIAIMDEPGSGGAHHNYLLYWPIENGLRHLQIGFQKGPIKEVGVNGVTQEALLAIVAHRLECFQAGPFACEENAQALEHVNAALAVLKARTLARQKRGVEGTTQA
jgi:hypothetical protein